MIFNILIVTHLLIKVPLDAVKPQLFISESLLAELSSSFVRRLFDENLILNFWEMRDQVRVSKTLSYLLRHQAVKEGLRIDSAGFVSVE